MPKHVQRHKIAAVVVLYGPSADMLANIPSYAAQVDEVIAVDNTEVPDRQLVEQLEQHGVHYVSLGGNRGIGAALNVGCGWARELGCDWALTLDQDSTPTAGMVTRLRDCADTQPPELGPLAIVAPIWEIVGGLPEPTSEDCRDIEVTMTSGSLTNLAAFHELGGFREDFFIDRVDSEYCLRARRHGWRVVQQRDAVILHRMGQLRKATFPVRCWVTDYSPVRRYYMVRNLLEVRREYRREFPGWVAIERLHWPKELAKVMLAEPHRLEKVKMMARGWLDYRRRRFGKYEDLHPKKAVA